jgi:hypothetical protein
MYFEKLMEHNESSLRSITAEITVSKMQSLRRNSGERKPLL